MVCVRVIAHKVMPALRAFALFTPQLWCRAQGYELLRKWLLNSVHDVFHNAFE